MWGEARGRARTWPPQQPQLHRDRSRRASRPTSLLRQFGCRCRVRAHWRERPTSPLRQLGRGIEVRGHGRERPLQYLSRRASRPTSLLRQFGCRCRVRVPWRERPTSPLRQLGHRVEARGHGRDRPPRHQSRRAPYPTSLLRNGCRRQVRGLRCERPTSPLRQIGRGIEARGHGREERPRSILRRGTIPRRPAYDLWYNRRPGSLR